MTQQPPKRRDDPFRWVLDVSAMLMVAPGERESLQPVARAIGEGMNASGADILSYDPEKGALVQEATWDPEGISAQDLAFLGTELPLDDYPGFKRLIVSKRIEERHADDIDLTHDEIEMFAEWGYKTTLDAPLIIGDEVLGALGVTEKRYPRHFMTMEIQRFEKFASMAAAAIRNARVFRRDQQQSQQLEMLLELSRLLTTSTDLSPALAASAQTLATGLGASWAAFYEIGEAGAEPRLVAWQAAAASPGESVESLDDLEAGDASQWAAGLADVLASRESRLLNAADPVLDGDLRAAMLRRGEHARLGLPLVCRSNLVGLLVMAWSDSDPDLQSEQLQFARSAAELLAFALENARLEAAAGS